MSEVTAHALRAGYSAGVVKQFLSGARRARESRGIRITPRLRGVSALLLLLCAIPGCSTLARGPNQTVSLKTDAPDATVYVGKLTLHAPCEFRLTRKQTYTVLITAPGRQSVQFDLVPHFDGMSLGNLIYPGGSLGVLTDFLTGADKKFTPVKMVKLPVLDPKLPTLVVLRQHKDQLMTREELDALKQGGVAASMGGRPEMAVGGVMVGTDSGTDSRAGETRPASGAVSEGWAKITRGEEEMGRWGVKNPGRRFGRYCDRRSAPAWIGGDAVSLSSAE